MCYVSSNDLLFLKSDVEYVLVLINNTSLTTLLIHLCELIIMYILTKHLLKLIA